MRGATIILIAMVVVGFFLYILDVVYYRRKIRKETPEKDEKEVAEAAPEHGGEGEACCGLHLVCEKTRLLKVAEKIEYYDDEELDRFAGREADDYSSEEIEEFRDVLLTLLPQDVAGWAASIELRQITLPTEVRDELLMRMGEVLSGK